MGRGGCQPSKASGEACSRARLTFWAKSKGGDHQRWAHENSPPSWGGSSSWVSAPECKMSAEKKREPGSQARKGTLLEGKQRVTGS